jgi:nicotinate-nucleotide pyrophosphorylase (carboxylating)
VTHTPAHTPAQTSEPTLEALAESIRASDDFRSLLNIAHHEDLGDRSLDLTGELMFTETDTRAVALTAREPCTIAGLAFIAPILERFTRPSESVTIDLRAADADRADKATTLATFTGSARAIVRAERTILNLVSRLSGIATLTRAYSGAIAHTSARICDTRKTTPGWRTLEKYAVRCGGGTSHRMGLHDALLIKDNHLAHLSESELLDRVTTAAAAHARKLGAAFVQVEVDTLAQLDTLLTLPPGTIDMVLLDNMTPSALAQAVEKRDTTNPALILEASGGVTLATVSAIAETGVNRISIGALTHQAQSVDLGFDTL